jgi:hypothetical protein
LVLIALKWRNNRGTTKNYGKHLQPSTWETKLKYLFSVFRKQNVNYNYATDFNGDGEFHAVLASQWGSERELKPNFASGVGTSTFDMEADRKLRDKYDAGDFNPFSTEVTPLAYEHRRKYLIYVLGRYFLLRGRNEIAYCYWRQIKFSELICDGVLQNYVEVLHQWDKSHKCKLRNTKPRDLTDIPPRIYANANDSLCPVRFLLFFRGLCAPTQECVLCNPANKAILKEFQLQKLPYLYNQNLPIGPNTISTATKELALEMGFKDWERCTGHGLRKMGITNAITYGDKNIAPLVMGMSRHKNYQTSLLYQKPSETMYQNYNCAVLGKNVPSPPREELGNKRLCTSSASERNDLDSATSDRVDSATNRNDLAAVSVSSNASSGNTTLKEDKRYKGIEGREYLDASDHYLPPEITTLPENSSMSGNVSSISGMVMSNDVSIGNNARVSEAVVPYLPGGNHPIIEHSRTERNIIVHPPFGNRDTFLPNYYKERNATCIQPYSSESVHNASAKLVEEKRELMLKVKELEFRLETQKEKYDDIKEDLKEAKVRAQKAEWHLMKRMCVVM